MVNEMLNVFYVSKLGEKKVKNLFSIKRLLFMKNKHTFLLISGSSEEHG